ncbi:sodium-dependent phosphate transport protein 4 isoform X3 [Papio anubis]|uniref:sodium-dependent phosphate transport protein 4 isoform X3 n=1 Tax=Papio anubis TaxID=9555 RepID=UPI000B7B50AD|nr:sodium-dependent phosphate transport protein 4 isoform X3 [Papio anubis]XP_031522839.1 sodium-dependent phosphate transport protein 4 isoform X3 [Papio anubis]
MATKTELSPTARESKNAQDMQVDEVLIPRKVPSLCSARYGIALVLHFCNFTTIAQNVIMNITMVAMVNSTSPQSQFNGSSEGLPVDSFGDLNKAPKSLSAKAPVYDWSPQIQGIIFGAVGYGGILTMAPSGYLAGRVGTKRVVGISLFATSFLTLCIPLAADFGIVFLIVTRIVQGLSQCSVIGGQFAIWEKWGPPHERSRLCSIALSGMLLGCFSAILIGGFISETLGWPFVFYIFGGVGCVCCLLWFIVIYDDPTSYPWISTSEKEYITSSLKQQVRSSQQPLPIKAVLRSLPIWSICLGCFSHQWLVSTMIVYIPTYISSVYHINIRDLYHSNCLADALMCIKHIVSVRDLHQCLRYCSKIHSWIRAEGYCQTSLDLDWNIPVTHRHSSFLMGASRGFSSMAPVIVPTVSGFLLSQDPEFGWRNVFFLLFAINLSGLIFYLIFGEADVQDWAKERKLTRL